jgi:protein-disulfide isomerase
MSLNKINTVTELWQTTYNWLLLSGIQLNEKYCREEITTHPDYPALTAVSDFLEAGSMAYNAVQADASYINEFNYPVLAHISKPGQEYLYLISNARKWDIEKEITRHWSGIVFYPEKDATWFNGNNSIAQKVTRKNKQYVAVLVFIGLCLLATAAFNLTNPAIVAFGLLSFIGVVISVFLSGAELGYQSQLVKQVCGAVSNGGCEKVLKSKYAKGLFGITPADAALLYFSTQFIVYLVGSLFPFLLQSTILLSFAGIAIAGWSIYTQAIKVKQWCALCLGIVSVLLLQALTASFLISTPLIVTALATPVIVFAVTCMVLLIAWLPVKQLIKTNNANQQKLAELKKWKTDANIFHALWQKEQPIDTTIWQHDLVIGDLAAPILITVACNPYCGPCAKAHHQLDELLDKFSGKLKVQVRLLCNPTNEDDIRTIAVSAILQQAFTLKSNGDLRQMLTDWFSWMNYEKWNCKWVSKDRVDTNVALKKHTEWMNENNITHTPTFFVNGRRLPGRYSLNDLEKLIPQLVEAIKIV